MNDDNDVELNPLLAMLKYPPLHTPWCDYIRYLLPCNCEGFNDL